MAIFPCIFSLPELNIKQLSAGYNYENESNIGDNTIITLVFLGLKTLFSTSIWMYKTECILDLLLSLVPHCPSSCTSPNALCESCTYQLKNLYKVTSHSPEPKEHRV